MQNKHIIFLINSAYPYYTGGRETWIYEVCKRLIDKYDISILSEKLYKNNPEDGCFDDIDKRISIYPIKSLKSNRLFQAAVRSYIVALNEYFVALGMKKKLKSIINNDQKTYIIAMDSIFMPRAWYGLKTYNITRIISYRGKHLEIYNTYWKYLSRSLKSIEKNNLKNSDSVWANGYDTQEYIKGKGYESTVIFNGVDCSKIRVEQATQKEVDEISSWKPMVFTIGSLLDLKGYPDMIRTIKLIKDVYNVEAHLVAYGKGDKTKYIKMAEELNISENVHFMGERRNAAILAKYADVIWTLGTSIGAGMSMATLELLSSGKIVVAWENACYKQLIGNNINGFLIEEGNINNLASKTVEILNNSEANKRIGKKAIEIASKNDWANVIKMIEGELV